MTDTTPTTTNTKSATRIAWDTPAFAKKFQAANIKAHKEGTGLRGLRDNLITAGIKEPGSTDTLRSWIKKFQRADISVFTLPKGAAQRVGFSEDLVKELNAAVPDDLREAARSHVAGLKADDAKKKGK